MAIRNVLKGGTDFVTGEILEDFDLDDTYNSFYRKAYADNTGGSHTGTTETDVATLTIGAGELGTTASLIISAGCSANYNVNCTLTLRLKVDGATVKTITFTNGNNISYPSFDFNYLHASLDNTSAVIVKVTAQASVTGNSIKCDGLTVDGVYNNS